MDKYFKGTTNISQSEIDFYLSREFAAVPEGTVICDVNAFSKDDPRMMNDHDCSHFKFDERWCGCAWLVDLDFVKKAHRHCTHPQARELAIACELELVLDRL